VTRPHVLAVCRDTGSARRQSSGSRWSKVSSPAVVWVLGAAT